jgi:hypothetical protein
MGSFVPRLLVLTVIWLLATAAITFAAAQRIGTVHLATTTTTTTTATAPTVLVVPDVRHQAYVFAKGTLSDAGFGWLVAGSVEGYASNTVGTQSPVPGTRVIDTGAPKIVLHLVKAGRQIGVPEAFSAIRGTRIQLEALATEAAPPAVTTTATTTPPVKTTAPVTKKTAKTPTKAPSRKLPQNRPPAFVVTGARPEPLDEMPLTDRARKLLAWVAAHPKPTDANVKYWLYQHAWIVTGAEMGWWHGADALHQLVTVDQRVWQLWGIGDRSEAVARQALAKVETKS